jgi:ferritin
MMNAKSQNQKEVFMDKKLHDLIEDQINKELWSAYIYYDAAEFYRGKGLKGLHDWFTRHAGEEVGHAEKFCEYLQDQDQAFVMKAVAVPPKSYQTIRDPLTFQVEHEHAVTLLITAIYERAKEVKDYGSEGFLVWYINEQVEEEKTAKDVLQQFDLYAKDGGLALHEFDEAMGKDKD